MNARKPEAADVSVNHNSPQVHQESRSARRPAVRSMKHMGVKVAQRFVAVDDHDRALTFYRDILGFEVRQDHTFEGLRWVALGSPGQPDADIVLQSLVVYPETSPADQQALAELLVKGLLPGLVFRTEDCDATFEHLRARGATVSQEPTDQPWGVRDCAFRDPAGNALRFAQLRRRRKDTGDGGDSGDPPSSQPSASSGRNG